MLDPCLVERIRTIFLHDQHHVTISEAASLLGWTRGKMNAAIRNGEIESYTACSGPAIELRDIAAKALDQWSLIAVEEALGRDAALVMPPSLRTRKFTVRLPLYQIALLKILSDEGSESVDSLLERMFSELAGNEQERVGIRIAGLAEAIRWPEVVNQSQQSS